MTSEGWRLGLKTVGNSAIFSYLTVPTKHVILSSLDFCTFRVTMWDRWLSFLQITPLNRACCTHVSFTASSLRGLGLLASYLRDGTTSLHRAGILPLICPLFGGSTVNCNAVTDGSNILYCPPPPHPVLAEDAIKAALKDYKLKQEKLRDASSEEAVAQWSIHKHTTCTFTDTSATNCIAQCHYVLIFTCPLGALVLHLWTLHWWTACTEAPHLHCVRVNVCCIYYYGILNLPSNLIVLHIIITHVCTCTGNLALYYDSVLFFWCGFIRGRRLFIEKHENYLSV